VANVDSSNISDRKDRDTVAFGGVVNNIREVTTKKKEVMAYITIEDLRGTVTVICFADLYNKAFGLVHSEEPVLIKGTIDAGEEGVKVIASEIIPLSDAAEQPYDVVHFSIDASRSSAIDIDSLHKLLINHKGKCDGFIRIVNSNNEVIVYLGRDFQLELTDRLKAETDRLLGTGATRFCYRTIETE
jgi:DNA polymerase-3 subunit alpha